MRKLVLIGLLLITAIFVMTRVTEVKSIAETMRNGDWRFLALAFVIELFWLLNIAITYRFIYRSLGLREKLPNLVLMSSAANFVNVVAPTAGMGGMAVMIDGARKRGHSSGRATVASVLFVLFDYLGFMIVLSFGIIVLIRRGTLNSAELVASSILFIVACILAMALIIGMRSPRSLARINFWVTNRSNYLFKIFSIRKSFSERNAYILAYDIADGLVEIRRKPRNILIPAGLALSNKLLLVGILLLMFLSFNVTFSIGTLIAGFSIGYLFFVVSPTPSGIGFVEGALTLALVSLYVPVSKAAAVALAYRGITFWIPLLIGMLAFRFVSRDLSLNSSSA
jgi:uncharacterized protein (TIRG00374 family)